MAARLGQRLKALDELTGRRGHVDRLRLEPELPGVEPREVEQVRREPRQAVDLPAGRLQEVAPRSLVEILVGEELEEAAERKERACEARVRRWR